MWYHRVEFGAPVGCLSSVCWCKNLFFILKKKSIQRLVLLFKELEREELLQQAEKHYVDGGDWKMAVNMYRQRVRICENTS